LAGLLSPALALAAILSTLYATLFHLWRRGDLSALRTYLFATWLGFAAGHLLGNLAGLELVRIGHLDVLCGTIGAITALLIAWSLEA
jgi:hypothetical protein